MLDAGGLVDLRAPLDVASGRGSLTWGYDDLQVASMEIIDRFSCPLAKFSAISCRSPSAVPQSPRSPTDAALPTSVASVADVSSFVAPSALLPVSLAGSPASSQGGEFEDRPCFNCRGSGHTVGTQCCICRGCGKEPVEMPALSLPSAPVSPIALAMKSAASVLSPPGHGQGFAGLYASMVLAHRGGGGGSPSAGPQLLVPLTDTMPPTSLAPPTDASPHASSQAVVPWSDSPIPAVEAPEVSKARERAARGRANVALTLRQAAHRRAAAASAAVAMAAESAAAMAATIAAVRAEASSQQKALNEAFCIEPRRITGKRRLPGNAASPSKVGFAPRAESLQPDQEVAAALFPSITFKEASSGKAQRVPDHAAAVVMRQVSGKRASLDRPRSVCVDEKKVASKRPRTAQ